SPSIAASSGNPIAACRSASAVSPSATARPTSSPQSTRPALSAVKPAALGPRQIERQTERLSVLIESEPKLQFFRFDLVFPADRHPLCAKHPDRAGPPGESSLAHPAHHPVRQSISSA